MHRLTIGGKLNKILMKKGERCISSSFKNTTNEYTLKRPISKELYDQANKMEVEIAVNRRHWKYSYIER